MVLERIGKILLDEQADQVRVLIDSMIADYIEALKIIRAFIGLLGMQSNQPRTQAADNTKLRELVPAMQPAEGLILLVGEKDKIFPLGNNLTRAVRRPNERPLLL